MIITRAFEEKNVFEWTPYDYLSWLRAIQEIEEVLGDRHRARFIRTIANGLEIRITTDTKNE